MRRLAVALGAVLLFVSLPAGAMTDDATVTVWQSGGLGDNTLGATRLTAAIQGGTVAIVHEGTLRLMGVTRGSLDVQRPEAGFGYPMAVSAIDLGDAHLLDADLPEPLTSGIVMSERSAALRGARAGDIVELEGWNGEVVSAVIAGVLPDERIGWAEIVMSTLLADRLGFERPSRAFIAGVDAAETAELFDRLAPEAPLQVGFPDRPVVFSDPTMSTVSVKERFGEFAFRPTGVGDGIEIEESWLAANIVTVRLPVLGVFRCNRAVVPYIRSAVSEMQRTGAIAGIDPVDFQIAGGCFNSRMMRGGDKGFALSRHAWGLAIDFNPSTNRYGDEVTLDPAIGEIMRQWGFAWGAGWTVPDGMHFEWTHVPDIRSTCGTVQLVRPAGGRAGWQVVPRATPCGSVAASG